MTEFNRLANGNKCTNSFTDEPQPQNVSIERNLVDRSTCVKSNSTNSNYRPDDNLAHGQKNLVNDAECAPKAFCTSEVLRPITPKPFDARRANLSLDFQGLKHPNSAKNILDTSEGRNHNFTCDTNNATPHVKNYLGKENFNQTKLSPQGTFYPPAQGRLNQSGQENPGLPKRSAAKVSFRNQKSDSSSAKDSKNDHTQTFDKNAVSPKDSKNDSSSPPVNLTARREKDPVSIHIRSASCPTDQPLDAPQGVYVGRAENAPLSINILRPDLAKPERTYDSHALINNPINHPSKAEVLPKAAREIEGNDLNIMKKRHNWLQNPILFYLSENLIKLHELRTKYKQNQSLSPALLDGKVIHCSTLSLDSAFNPEYLQQLETLKRYITYSVSEIEGILLNPLFTSWSDKSLRKLLKKVTTSWRDGGLDSEGFEEASFLLLKAISEERCGTIRHTWLYRLREYFGAVQHHRAAVWILSIMALMELVFLVLLAVFVGQHYIVRIVLLILVGVAFFFIYCFCLLIINHNSSVDATAAFFKMEILSLSKDTNSSDDEDSFAMSESSSRCLMSSYDERAFTPYRVNAIKGEEKVKIAYSMEPNMTQTGAKKFTPMKALPQRTQVERREQGENAHSNEVPTRRHGSEKQRHPKEQPQRTLSKIIKTDKLPDSVLMGSQYLLGAESTIKNGISNNLGDTKGTATTVNATFIIDLADSISITALIYCNDEYVLSMLMPSLWQFNFLVLRAQIPQINSIYQQGSDKYKIIIVHAPDLLEGTADDDLVSSWINEKLPVFFISCHSYRFSSIVPTSQKLQSPLTEENIISLILSGTGKDGRLNSTRMGASCTSLKAPRYTLGRRLGGGAYGNVFEAEMEETGVMCAVKRIYLKNSADDNGESVKNHIDQLRDIAREVEIMSSLTHPNVVQYLFCERDDNCISIFMELCLGGSLSRLINNGELLDPDFIKQVLRDIVSAVAYLHRKKVTHRDLKPDNVLFTNRRAKLTDFGTAILKRNRESLSPVTGTFAYMAPEIVLCEVCGNACDMWSIGCIAAEIFKVDLPHRSLGLPGMCDFYRKMDMNSALEIDCSVAEVKDFLRCCLQRNPNLRSTAGELLHHDCLKHNNIHLDKWMKEVLSKKSHSRTHTTVALNLFDPNKTGTVSDSQLNMLSLKSFDDIPNR